MTDLNVREYIAREYTDKSFTDLFAKFRKEISKFDYISYSNTITEKISNGTVSPYGLLRELIIKAYHEEYYQPEQVLEKQVLPELLPETYIAVNQELFTEKKDDFELQRTLAVDETFFKIDNMQSLKATKLLKEAYQDLSEVPSWVTSRLGTLNLPTGDILQEAFATRDPRSMQLDDMLSAIDTIINAHPEESVINDAKKLEDPFLKYDTRVFSKYSLISESSVEVEDQQLYRKDIDVDITNLNDNDLKSYMKNRAFINTQSYGWIASITSENVSALPIAPNVWNEKIHQTFLENLRDPELVYIPIPSHVRVLDSYYTQELKRHKKTLFNVKFDRITNELCKLYYPEGHTPGPLSMRGGLYDKYSFMVSLHLKMFFVENFIEKDPLREEVRRAITHNEVKRIPTSYLGWALHFATLPFRFIKNIIISPVDVKLDMENYVKMIILEDPYKPWKMWNVDHSDIRQSSYWKAMSKERQDFWDKEIKAWETTLAIAKYKLSEIGSVETTTNFEGVNEMQKEQTNQIKM